MDNRHNPNKNPKAMDEIGDRFQALGLESNDDVRTNPNYGSPNGSHLYNNHRTALNNSKLNPNAQEFVPRQSGGSAHCSFPVSMGASHHQSPHPNSHSSAYINGNNHPGEQQGEPELEDYVALSYLKEFINSISSKPNIFERGIGDITYIVNSYLDEDECILELIVNQIVDQSIIDVDFRYNGVRLCHHFMEKLRQTRSGQTFKTLLFKRCQRECSREVTKTTSENTFNHLRGLALFIADLYSRSNEPELGEHIPKLLLNMLSGNSKLDENVKIVCQVLKLCGQQLDKYFREKNSYETLGKVVDNLREKNNCDLSNSAKMMVKNVLGLADNGWVQPQVASVAGRANPYLNMDMSAVPPQGMYPQANNFGMYDFGDCGDEFNEDVIRSFEQFISSNNVNSDNALQ